MNPHSDPTDPDRENSSQDDAPDRQHQEEERYIDDLIARGQAVPEGEPLPPGATHVVERDSNGRRRLRRIRFTAT